MDCPKRRVVLSRHSDGIKVVSGLPMSGSPSVPEGGYRDDVHAILAICVQGPSCDDAEELGASSHPSLMDFPNFH